MLQTFHRGKASFNSDRLFHNKYPTKEEQDQDSLKTVSLICLMYSVIYVKDLAMSREHAEELFITKISPKIIFLISLKFTPEAETILQTIPHQIEETITIREIL